jgi:hypothetical protein
MGGPDVEVTQRELQSLFWLRDFRFHWFYSVNG